MFYIPKNVPRITRVPFVPSSWDSVKTMVEIADVKHYEKAADLGSGDGRVVIELAKKGIETHGYEIDFDLIIQSEKRILQENLDKNIFIHYKNYWEEDLSNYNIITIYGMASIMDKLAEKLKKELKPGSKVISNVFTFPNLKPDLVKNNIYRYIIP